MAMIDNQGRLLGRFNVIDVATLVLLFCIALGVLLVQSGNHRTSGQMVTGEADIEYTVMLYNTRALRTDMLQPGEPLSITIRNRPRGNVEVVSVEWKRRQFPLNMGGGAVKMIDDPTFLNGYDALITVRDHANVTKEGYVTNGVKVKIGMPIDIEGFDYRLGGTIVDLHKVSKS